MQAPTPEPARSQRFLPDSESNSPSIRPGSISRGFSLLELLLVVALILTIVAIAIPSLRAAVDQARLARAIGDIRTIESQILAYDGMFGQYPDNLNQIGYGNILDPWGNPYQYYNHDTGTGNGFERKDRFLVPLNRDYDLYSMGKDGKSSPPLTAHASQDDVIRAAGGNFVGLASQF